MFYTYALRISPEAQSPKMAKWQKNLDRANEVGPVAQYTIVSALLLGMMHPRPMPSESAQRPRVPKISKKRMT